MVLLIIYVEKCCKVSAFRNKMLPEEQVFLAHHSLDIWPEIIVRMRDSFRELKESGKLHHGSGTYNYGDWAVWL